MGRFQKTMVETPARDVAGNCPDADSPLRVARLLILQPGALLLRLTLRRLTLLRLTLLRLTLLRLTLLRLIADS
jgi:hypothetical protein